MQSLHWIHPGIARVPVIAACLVAALLTGCAHERFIKSGAQLSADGKAIATTYSDFMATSADMVAAECELKGFDSMLAVRKSGRPASVWAANALDCEQQKRTDSAYLALTQWAKDGQAVAKTYDALARITGDANTDTLKASFDGAAAEIASAADAKVSPKVSAALAALSKAIVQARESDGIRAFAGAMQGVPEAMLATLNDKGRTDYFDVLYRQYDKAVASARDQAYAADIVDALAGTEKFASRLGVTLNVPNRKDPYLAAFSKQYNKPPTVTEQGLATRDKLLESLRNLSAETDRVSKGQTETHTLRDDLADLRRGIQVLKSILHPDTAPSNATASK